MTTVSVFAQESFSGKLITNIDEDTLNVTKNESVELIVDYNQKIQENLNNVVPNDPEKRTFADLGFKTAIEITAKTTQNGDTNESHSIGFSKDAYDRIGGLTATPSQYLIDFVYNPSAGEDESSRFIYTSIVSAYENPRFDKTFLSFTTAEKVIFFICD